MSSVNKVILVGNCGRDPEVRYLPSGGAVANVSIATTTKRKDRNSGEMVTDTQWHRLTFFERLAEIAGQYVKKGSSIYVEGRLKYGSYKDNAGVEKPTVEIVVTELQLLGGRNEAQSGGQSNQSYQRNSADQGNNRPQQSQQGGGQPNAPKGNTNGGRFDDFDDDIPF